MRLLGLQPFLPSPSAFHFAGFVSSMLQASRTTTEISTFPPDVWFKYRWCLKMVQRCMSKKSQKCSPQKLGPKHVWGEDSYMFLDRKISQLRTHLKRCQPGQGASRQVISFFQLDLYNSSLLSEERVLPFGSLNNI